MGKVKEQQYEERHSRAQQIAYLNKLPKPDVHVLTEFEQRALTLLARYSSKDQDGIHPKEFAVRMWPRSPMHSSGAKYDGQYQGGSKLRALVKRGLAKAGLTKAHHTVYRISDEGLAQLSYLKQQRYGIYY